VSDSASRPSSSQKSFTSSSGGAGAPNASVYMSACILLSLPVQVQTGQGRQQERNDLPGDKCLSNEAPNPSLPKNLSDAYTEHQRKEPTSSVISELYILQ
jgi:hypothetical protein